LAVSLIATPPVIFLDEPTTGLDPRSRLAMWNIIQKLMDGGTTILLTTQYLEEADQLADRIVVIDGGKVIANGTPAELKSKVGRDRLELVFADDAGLKRAIKALKAADNQVSTKDHTVSLTIEDTNRDVKQALDVLTTAKVSVTSMAIHKPTLDDVFLTLTGRTKAEAEAEAEPDAKPEDK
jgi:ABC-2 type transport system ATP-binding protein